MKLSNTVIQGSFIVLILLTFVPFPPNDIIHSQTNISHSLSLENSKDMAVSRGFSFFPLGIFGVRNSTEIWDAWKHRFNTVIFGFGEPKDLEKPFIEIIEDMLLTCDVLGMNVLFDVSYFLRENDLLGLERHIRNIIGHPSIYAWFIWNDAEFETNETRVNLIDLIQLAGETIHGVDNRPTFAQFSSNTINETIFRLLPEHVDILNVTPFSNMPYVNHSLVADRVDTLIEYNADRAKMGVVLTAQDSSQSLGEQGYDIPTEPEYMMDAVLALQRGVEGLNWFTYGQLDSKIYGVRVFSDSWNVLGRVIRRISQVAPILVGRENEMTVFPIDENLDASYAKRGNQTVLFLANHDYYWNSTETEWTLRNHMITLEVPDVVSISIIEPSGPKYIDFMLVGSALSFNVTVNGGVFILLVTPSLISTLELPDPLIGLLSSLILIVIFYRFRNLKKSYLYFLRL